MCIAERVDSVHSRRGWGGCTELQGRGTPRLLKSCSSVAPQSMQETAKWCDGHRPLSLFCSHPKYFCVLGFPQPCHVGAFPASCRRFDDVWVRQITPLHEACAAGHEECVTALLKARAHPNLHKTNSSVTNGGFTPLHFAAANGHVQIVDHLLLAKADVRALTAPRFNKDNLPSISHSPIYFAGPRRRQGGRVSAARGCSQRIAAHGPQTSRGGSGALDRLPQRPHSPPRSTLPIIVLHCEKTNAYLGHASSRLRVCRLCKVTRL